MLEAIVLYMANNYAGLWVLAGLLLVSGLALGLVGFLRR